MTPEEKKRQHAERERDRRKRKREERVRVELKAAKLRAGNTPAEALIVLDEAGVPLDVAEITRRIQSRGFARLNAGPNAEWSVSSRLATLAKDPDSPVVVVDGDKYATRFPGLVPAE